MRSKESKVRSLASSSRRASSIRTRATKSLLINNEDFAEPLVAIPPDGGWGWVVVAASFFNMFCVDGVGYCFGIFFQDISEDLNCKVTDVALTTSLMGGFYYLAGPITCSAINRFGFQAIVVLGGMIAIITFLSASLMTNVLPFTVVVGLCGGTAFNLIYTPSVIAIGFYFERWRALAMSINCCGSSLGVICLPIIMTQLFEKLSWRKKFQILAAVFGVCGFLGFTYRPIKTARIERTVQFGEMSTLASIATLERERELSDLGGLTGIFQRFKNTLFPTISEMSVDPSRYSSRGPSRRDSKVSGFATGYLWNRRSLDPEALSTYLQIESDENLDGKGVLVPVQEESNEDDVGEKEGYCKKCCRKRCYHCPTFWICSACCNRKRSDEASYTTINRPLYRDDIFYTGSVNVISQSRTGHTTPTLQKKEPSIMYTLSVTRAPTQRDLQQQGQCVCCPDAVVRVLATMLNYQMLKSPTFILLLISGYLSLVGTYICYIYLAERAIELGIDKQSATLLLSVLGISNTIGRALCGVVSCFEVDINLISWVSLGICGIITIVSVFLTTLTGQIVFCSIFGLTIATFAVLRTVLFVELFGIENLSNCFGLNMLFQSVAAFSGIPMATSIYRATHSFAAPFVFTGVIILLSAILLIPIRPLLKWEEKYMKK